MKTALLLIPAFAALPLFLQDQKPTPAHAPVPAQAAPKTTTIVKAADVKWADHPFIAGAKMCVEYGDPAKGPSVLLMKFPKGLTIPAHWHSSDETATVVSGSGTFGTGETVDVSKGTEITSGSYMAIPGKAPHWAVAKEDMIISVTVAGPSDYHAVEAKK